MRDTGARAFFAAKLARKGDMAGAHVFGGVHAYEFEPQLLTCLHYADCDLAAVRNKHFMFSIHAIFLCSIGKRLTKERFFGRDRAILSSRLVRTKRMAALEAAKPHALRYGAWTFFEHPGSLGRDVCTHKRGALYLTGRN